MPVLHTAREQQRRAVRRHQREEHARRRVALDRREAGLPAHSRPLRRGSSAPSAARAPPKAAVGLQERAALEREERGREWQRLRAAGARRAAQTASFGRRLALESRVAESRERIAALQFELAKRRSPTAQEWVR